MHESSSDYLLAAYAFPVHSRIVFLFILDGLGRNVSQFVSLVIKMVMATRVNERKIITIVILFQVKLRSN